jgi:hypothetical protein
MMPTAGLVQILWAFGIDVLITGCSPESSRFLCAYFVCVWNRISVTTLKSKGRARTQIAKQRKLRATKITRMAQQRHHGMEQDSFAEMYVHLHHWNAWHLTS